MPLHHSPPVTEAAASAATTISTELPPPQQSTTSAAAAVTQTTSTTDVAPVMSTGGNTQTREEYNIQLAAEQQQRKEATMHKMAAQVEQVLKLLDEAAAFHCKEEKLSAEQLERGVAHIQSILTKEQMDYILDCIPTMDKFAQDRCTWT